MSLLFRRESRGLGDNPNQLIPSRGGRTLGTVQVTGDTALQMSAVWASLQLRADLESTLPIDFFRRIRTESGRLDVEVPAPPFFTDPAGDGFGLEDWLFSGRINLDRFGNNVGIITQLDGNGRPARIELQPWSKIRVKGKGSKITDWYVGGKRYDPVEIWHERQFTIPGVPLGLSAITHAAASIGLYQSAEQVGLGWFAGGAIPAAQLKNTEKTITAKEARLAKARFKASVASGDIFVHGADWEFSTIDAAASEAKFLESMGAKLADVCRFLGVSADMIDVPAEGSGSITYANISQRNLQFLLTRFGPSVIRRERRLSTILAAPRFVKFNTDAFLRMDPQAREELLIKQVAGRTRVPSEARALANLEPFTDEQYAEFDRLWPQKSAAPEPKQSSAVDDPRLQPA